MDLNTATELVSLLQSRKCRTYFKICSILFFGSWDPFPNHNALFLSLISVQMICSVCSCSSPAPGPCGIWTFSRNGEKACLHSFFQFLLLLHQLFNISKYMRTPICTSTTPSKDCFPPKCISKTLREIQPPIPRITSNKPPLAKHKTMIPSPAFPQSAS